MNRYKLVDKETKKILGGPEILTRGFIYVKESQDLLEETKSVAREVIESNIEVNTKRVDYAKIKNDINIKRIRNRTSIN